MADDDEYEVQDIIDYRCWRGTHYFKIRWAGYSPDADTWEPQKNINNSDPEIMLMKSRAKERAKANGVHDQNPFEETTTTKAGSGSRKRKATEELENGGRSGASSSRHEASHRPANDILGDLDILPGNPLTLLDLKPLHGVAEGQRNDPKRWRWTLELDNGSHVKITNERAKRDLPALVIAYYEKRVQFGPSRSKR